MSALRYTYTDKTILEFTQLWENGHLNLEPGFQRQSVWSLTDRRKLVQSLLDGYPIPSIFLYRRTDNGMPVYDVIDGKQRLETILMFSRAKRFSKSGFEVKFQFPDDERVYWYDWSALKKWSLTADFLTNKIQTVEVEGDTSAIIDLFVRINSTGKALTGAEKRHARFFQSAFLKESARLANRSHSFFAENRILSNVQMSRMKDVELVSELLASIVNRGPINKKTAVDRAVGNVDLHARTLDKASREFIATINLLKRMFPHLKATRFCSISEFYSLFMVVWQMWDEGLVLTDRKRNDIAQRLLIRFSNGVDTVREMHKRISMKRQPPRLYTEYLLAVQQSTDALPQRKQRAEIVQGLFGGIFAAKDTQRVFSTVQRRLLWNSEERRKCTQCGKPLSWENFQVDHVVAHSKGGQTSLPNAALICRPCNSSKGARKAARKKKV